MRLVTFIESLVNGAFSLEWQSSREAFFQP